MAGRKESETQVEESKHYLGFTFLYIRVCVCFALAGESPGALKT
jgi:hypothetical protein